MCMSCIRAIRILGFLLLSNSLLLAIAYHKIIVNDLSIFFIIIRHFKYCLTHHDLLGYKKH